MVLPTVEVAVALGPPLYDSVDGITSAPNESPETIEFCRSKAVQDVIHQLWYPYLPGHLRHLHSIDGVEGQGSGDVRALLESCC